MPKSDSAPLNLVCLATYFKGTDFIRECKSQGCYVVLVTKEKMLNEPWPRDSLDDVIALPNDAGSDLFIVSGAENRKRFVAKLDLFGLAKAEIK